MPWYSGLSFCRSIHIMKSSEKLLLASVFVGLTITTEAAPAHSSLLVTSGFDYTVKEYDGLTGAFIRNAATGVGVPIDAIIGLDGNLLVTDGRQNAIRRFDWATGSFLGIFASAVSPVGMTMFGGKVYVCQGNPPHIVRSFDALTGADVGSFFPTVGGNPGPRDVKVANDRLYVAYWNRGTIEMFDLTTRASLGLLFPAGTGGLSTPYSIAFGPDGNIYVSYNYFVNRYHPTTGAFLGRFVDTGYRSGWRAASGIAWGPDKNLYVATHNPDGVQRYNGTTGAFMDDFVPPGSGGLTVPGHINFASVNRLPDCSSAQADPASLWPPDHRLVPISIVGVTDPDGDPVAVRVVSVVQDEPVNGPADGDTGPDAVMMGSGVSLRADRSGAGNGRVYTLVFMADDGRGGVCSGSVKVCVPHDRSPRHACVDDGGEFNSLGGPRP